jgi:hypothetical protein
MLHPAIDASSPHHSSASPSMTSATFSPQKMRGEGNKN